MKEVIEKLVEIENKAHRIIENASSEKLNIERDKKQELDQYKVELENEKEKKLNDLKKQIQDEIKPATESVYKEGNEKLSAMENHFVAEKEKMSEEVFQRIIGA